jgi:AcrR family transcriptional regulator
MLGAAASGCIRVCTDVHTPLYGMMTSTDGPIRPVMTAPELPGTKAAPAARKPRRRSAAPVPEAAAVQADAARASLTPETWVDAATAVLVDQGIDHVRVDVLATQLGVTRGSFYWHFRDRQDLLRRVLAAWREQTTVQLTRRLSNARSSAAEQLHDVISLPFRGRAAQRAARIELAIRAWARRDEMARAAVDEADAARIGYHASLFEALGHEPQEAQHRAFLLYGYEVAESLMGTQGSAAQKQARRAYVERLVVRGTAPA